MDKNIKTVLVVDDDKEIVDFVSNFLSRYKIQTIKAFSGQEAVTIYNNHKEEINTVFLDIIMPGSIDGIDALQKIRQLDTNSQVLMITGKPDEFREIAIKYGAVDYIKKPLDMMDLSLKIKKYVLGEKG